MKKPELLNIIQITPVVSFIAVLAVIGIGYYFHSFTGLRGLIIEIVMLAPVMGIIYGISHSRKEDN